MQRDCVMKKLNLIRASSAAVAGVQLRFGIISASGLFI